jgi:hypothetical protein
MPLGYFIAIFVQTIECHKIVYQLYELSNVIRLFTYAIRLFYSNICANH